MTCLARGACGWSSACRRRRNRPCGRSPSFPGRGARGGRSDRRPRIRRCRRPAPVPRCRRTCPAADADRRCRRECSRPGRRRCGRPARARSPGISCISPIAPFGRSRPRVETRFDLDDGAHEVWTQALARCVLPDERLELIEQRHRTPAGGSIGTRVHPARRRSSPRCRAGDRTTRDCRRHRATRRSGRRPGWARQVRQWRR